MIVFKLGQCLAKEVGLTPRVLEAEHNGIPTDALRLPASGAAAVQYLACLGPVEKDLSGLGDVGKLEVYRHSGTTVLVLQAYNIVLIATPQSNFGYNQRLTPDVNKAM